jgi:protein phosphatase
VSDAFLFETGTASHVGKVRSVNEDRFVARPEIGLWAVADGMGGHGSGDVASGMVADSLGALAPPASAPDLLAGFEAQIIRANAELKRFAAAKGADVIGSTVVALLTYGRHYAIVWSGDSRLYLLRKGKLAQLSRDHTEAQELVDNRIIGPEEARTWPRRNVVTRAIGVYDEAELELENGNLEAGDRFVLCSDGLTGHVEDGEIAETVAAERPQAACDALIALTLSRGATDNVTVVVVECREKVAEKTVRVPSK